MTHARTLYTTRTHAIYHDHEDMYTRTHAIYYEDTRTHAMGLGWAEHSTGGTKEKEEKNTHVRMVLVCMSIESVSEFNRS